MTSQERVVLFPDGGEDFGLAGHLAAIERMYREGVEHMYREALGYMEALAQPWPSRLGRATSETEVLPVTGQPQVRGAHAAAA
jgi:hypothetical protein